MRHQLIHFNSTTRRATGALLLACASAAAAQPVSYRSPEPFWYGYISSNVDCTEPGKPPRMKFVSQTFAYCLAEVPRAQIIEDNKVFFRQIAKASCGDQYAVSFEYVNVSATAAQAERDHEQSLKEQGYGKFVEWHASVDYYTSKCR